MVHRLGGRRTAGASRSTRRRRPSAPRGRTRRVEVGVELAVEHAQHVAVELGGHAGGVVVGGDEPVDVLHEVGAEQERVAGRERRGEVGEERGARPRGRGCRWCCRGTRRAGCHRRAGRRGGARSRRRPRGRRCRRTPSATAAAASRRVCSLTSNGTKRSRVPASRSASSRIRVFSDVPEPELDERVGPGELGDVAAWATRIAALGAGRVVLGEPGDLVEELAAAVVVEPLRRQRLRGGAEARHARRRPSARATSSGARCTSTTMSAVMGLPFTARSCGVPSARSA